MSTLLKGSCGVSCRLFQLKSLYFRKLVLPNACLYSTATKTSRKKPVVDDYPWSFYTLDPINKDEPKFKKILIANRGEIACRVIKTCRAMGIKTVAIYSEADGLAVHTRMADEAVCVGPPPTAKSYLNMEMILNAIDQSGAEAVHPGYGFLSENTDFVAKLEQRGVVFIGPNSQAIKAMGDKIQSKRIALDAKVSTIPGYDGVVKDEEDCVKIANQIGYPVMIKASAGGGGKGMRIAWNDKEAKEGFRLSSQEAKSSFGDDRLLVEKFVDNPRHIEVQIIGDKHGNYCWLNERECSIQRRNQKVIEEAPSTFVDPDMRRAMGTEAVQLAAAVGYDSAGTVEFLVDSKAKSFYFLEMNTRLQVEHPITEAITGLDLVQQMVRVAYGHPLNITQNDVGINGWAIESRVYAEDPYKAFGLPSVGRLISYKEPLHIPNVRCDSGIKEGSEISIYYDSMICKLVTYGAARQEALDSMVKALDGYIIKGVTHNIPLLRDIMTEKRFVEGDITTNYLPEIYPDGFKGKQLTEPEVKNLLAMAAVVETKQTIRSRNFFGPFRIPLQPFSETKFLLDVQADGHREDVEVTWTKDEYKVKFVSDGTVITISDNFSLADTAIEPVVNGTPITFQLLFKDIGGNIRLQYQGTQYMAYVLEDRTADYLQYMKEKPKIDTARVITAPMPGMIKSVTGNIGDTVVEGQEVCVIEAMKMQNSLGFGATGKIKTLTVKPGDTVEEDQILAELEPVA